MSVEILKELYTTYIGCPPRQIEKLPSSGSNREYFRLEGTIPVIGVCGESAEENRVFFYLSQQFSKQGIRVPEVFTHSDNGLFYLQEDLGDTLLFDAIQNGRNTGSFDETEKGLLRQTIQQLPTIQFAGAKEIDFSRCYPQTAFNARNIMWDLNYFKYCFLKASGLDFQEDSLEDDFKQMASTLLSCDDSPTPTFMYRDFQSRNVMIKNGHPYFIDFQGGRKGPIYYDVASFLWQAKANYPEDLRQELLAEYLDVLQTYQRTNVQVFHDRLKHFVLFRTLQVLGAYGFRGFFERKKHFIESIPFAIKNLRQLLQASWPEYPYLCKVLTSLTKMDKFSQPETKKLVVKVTSFSYKKGIPEDTTGNGGGFVFDCRAIHNPGRYERYHGLTGLDEPVAHFLEEDGEITSFLEHVCHLADASISRYLERGFTSLSICFGCTGGQHRSVYAAQHLAEHVYRKFKIEVDLEHREQNIVQTFKP